MEQPMSTDRYTLTVVLPVAPDEAEPRVRAALQEQGFGVLTEIDVEATLRAKLGVEVGPYRILGACNPPLARQAIELDPDVGALLPCNVVLRGNAQGGTDVVAADPGAMLAVGGPQLAPVAEEARQRLVASLEALRA
jgi:uncharacterized protein (DUF302 family)